MLADWLSPRSALLADAPINIDSWLAHRNRSLRPHQQVCLQELRQRWQQGQKRLLVALPTGAGKTRLAAEVTRLEVEAGRRVLWLVHRSDLVSQTVESLKLLHLPQDETVGVWQGGVENPNPYGSVQVATVQSLACRQGRPKADMIVIDECHHYVADHWRAIVNAYPEARRLMLSATPERADGMPMGLIAEHILAPVQPRQLIESGSLVPCAIVGPSEPLGSSELAQDPCDAWMSWGGGRRTIVFCESKRHARDVAARFVRLGVEAACVDEDTTAEERRSHYARLSSGDLKVITNVYVATEGLDIPQAEVCVMARTVSHRAPWLQMVGRVLRACKDKTSALVLDLNGVSHRLGSPEDDRSYSLGDTQGWTGGQEQSGAQAAQNLAAAGAVQMRQAMSVVGLPIVVLKGQEWFSPPTREEPLPRRSAGQRTSVKAPPVPSRLGTAMAPALPLATLVQARDPRDAYCWMLVEELYQGVDLATVFHRAARRYAGRFGEMPLQEWERRMARLLSSAVRPQALALPRDWPAQLRQPGHFMTSVLRRRFERGLYEFSLRSIMTDLGMAVQD